MTIIDMAMILGGYLLGAVPFGLLVARFMGGPDPRTGGSGNIGATNVTRMAGKKAGGLTLLLDAGKGYLPTVLAMHMLEPEPTALVGLAAVVGHCFSVYLGLRGGKGVATFLGVLLAISPWACLGVAALIAGLAWFSNYMAVGSLIGCLSAPFWLWWLGAGRPFILMAAAMGVVVVWRHRQNLGRLMRGEESSWRSKG